MGQRHHKPLHPLDLPSFLTSHHHKQLLLGRHLRRFQRQRHPRHPHHPPLPRRKQHVIAFRHSHHHQTSHLHLHPPPRKLDPIGAVTPELPGTISPFISSFEIQGHFSIRQSQRALDLIRRSWGWYLTHPNGTASTVIEGYLANGSFGYRGDRGYDSDASYVSHSHGWSSGPTSALTNYVLGLSVTAPAGGKWRLAPQFGDLTAVEGVFVTGLGRFQAAWSRTGTIYSPTSPNPLTEGIFWLLGLGHLLLALP
jgi:hypothetical protein